MLVMGMTVSQTCAYNNELTRKATVAWRRVY
ncbi:Uncharacterised protein [Mycobacteroides abscessus subsp. abscessus]|nr:Uncharacterised protein [Mycobacteroides abscessus subsp. abscessus]